MKSMTFSLLFLVFTSSIALADNCSDAYTQFQNKTNEILNHSAITPNDMKDFDRAYEELSLLLLGESCEKETLFKANETRTHLKEKRAASLRAQNPQNSCTDVINQNEAVNLDNVRNQDGLGWCYAYAAADLLSFRLKKKISAISLYDSGQSIEKDIFSDGKGGDIGGSIEDYLRKKNSLCLEEDLPSSDFQFCTYRNYANFLQALYQSIEENSLADNQCLNQNLNAAFPGVDFSVVNTFSAKYGSRNLAEYLYDLQCKKRSFVGYKVNPVSLTTPRFKPDDLLKKVDGLLDTGEIVGYACQYGTLSETTDDSKKGGHAMLIVGRRQNPETGDCEYLLRNSWGKDCTDAEGEGFTCDKKCDENNDCRYSGHLWVNSRRMKNAMEGITYLP